MRSVLHAVINAKPAPMPLLAYHVTPHGKEIHLQPNALVRLDIMITVYRYVRHAITAV